LDVWIDREDIKTGNTWRKQIVEAIDTCVAFVLVLSRHSAASDNVRKEIDLAQDSGRKVFVLLLEKTVIPSEIRYQLAGLQFADVEEFGLDASVARITQPITELLSNTEAKSISPSRQAELVIRGVDLVSFSAEKQQALLEFVENLVNVNRSQLQITDLRPGSVHAFVDMPVSRAFELKTLALNNDPRFKKFGVTAVRLVGDKRLITISIGVFTFLGVASLLKARWFRILFGLGGSVTGLIFAGIIIWNLIEQQRLPSQNIPQTMPVSQSSPVPQKTRITIASPDQIITPTGEEQHDDFDCYISIEQTFAYQGPSGGYNVVTNKRYHAGDKFSVIASDRTGEWLFGGLPDGQMGWLRIDRLSQSCFSTAIAVATYIPPLPPTIKPPSKITH
jgi:hypothetical protein